MSEIKIRIVTPLGEILNTKASSITIPTTSGMITVLHGHIPLISIIKSGELGIEINKVKSVFAVYDGIVEVKDIDQTTLVSIMTHRSELAENINTEQAEAAYQRAKELKDGLHKDDVEFSMFESLMEKELNRVRVSKRYR